jgi:hypothetical protein
MGILKYHPTSLISYEGGWPLACLEYLNIKPNQASHQGARWTSSVSMLKVPVLALIIETSAVWWQRSFQDICRGLRIYNYSRAYLWLISHDLSHGVPLMSWFWTAFWACSDHFLCLLHTPAQQEIKKIVSPVYKETVVNERDRCTGNRWWKG